MGIVIAENGQQVEAKFLRRFVFSGMEKYVRVLPWARSSR